MSTAFADSPHGSSPTGFSPRPLPGGLVLRGRDIAIEPFDWARHGTGLTKALAGPDNHDLWRYVPLGPFDDGEALGTALGARHDSGEWRITAICAAADGTVLGTASYMRLRPEHGSVEIGCVIHGRALRRSRAATEAHYLLAKHVFDLGYRRYEWKCDAANQASMQAARRLGFIFEGTFRQDMVVRGRNRDTAWFSIIDRDWPALEVAFTAWLDPANFDANGAQRKKLSALRDAR